MKKVYIVLLFVSLSLAAFPVGKWSGGALADKGDEIVNESVLVTTSATTIFVSGLGGDLTITVVSIDENVVPHRAALLMNGDPVRMIWQLTGNTLVFLGQPGIEYPETFNATVCGDNCKLFTLDKLDDTNDPNLQGFWAGNNHGGVAALFKIDPTTVTIAQGSDPVLQVPYYSSRLFTPNQITSQVISNNASYYSLSIYQLDNNSSLTTAGNGPGYGSRPTNINDPEAYKFYLTRQDSSPDPALYGVWVGTDFEGMPLEVSLTSDGVISLQEGYQMTAFYLTLKNANPYPWISVVVNSNEGNSVTPVFGVYQITGDSLSVSTNSPGNGTRPTILTKACQSNCGGIAAALKQDTVSDTLLNGIWIGENVRSEHTQFIKFDNGQFDAIDANGTFWTKSANGHLNVLFRIEDEAALIFASYQLSESNTLLNLIANSPANGTRPSLSNQNQCPGCSVMSLAKQDSPSDVNLAGIWAGTDSQGNQVEFRFYPSGALTINDLTQNSVINAEYYTRSSQSPKQLNALILGEPGQSGDSVGYVSFAVYEFIDSSTLNLVGNSPGIPVRPSLAGCATENCSQFTLTKIATFTTSFATTGGNSTESSAPTISSVSIMTILVAMIALIMSQ